jgi:hypothetical protein
MSTAFKITAAGGAAGTMIATYLMRAVDYVIDHVRSPQTLARTASQTATASLSFQVIRPASIPSNQKMGTPGLRRHA